jgi:putative sterol carrier protein
VVTFLADDWLDAMAGAAATASAPPELRLVVQQVVQTEAGEVAYAIHVADGRVRVVSGRADAPDVTFTQDEATARAVADGSLSAQAAFMEGRLRVGGDLRALLEHAAVLAGLDDVFRPARDAVAW